MRPFGMMCCMRWQTIFLEHEGLVRKDNALVRLDVSTAQPAVGAPNSAEKVISRLSRGNSVGYPSCRRRLKPPSSLAVFAQSLDEWRGECKKSSMRC